MELPCRQPWKRRAQPVTEAALHASLDPDSNTLVVGSGEPLELTVSISTQTGWQRAWMISSGGRSKIGSGCFGQNCCA
ncbi:MAG: hypothetical protein IPN59_17540 [Holophaga sp.]|nr:hypothetical protein [Holophaga sp.]